LVIVEKCAPLRSSSPLIAETFRQKGLGAGVLQYKSGALFHHKTVLLADELPADVGPGENYGACGGKPVVERNTPRDFCSLGKQALVQMASTQDELFKAGVCGAVSLLKTAML
jgi:hypothetical protein